MKKALPWILLLYGAASLLHFAHNAEHLTQYPNLPVSWTRADVYLAWVGVTTLGVIAYLLYLSRHRRVGLVLLALYAGLGFGGLLHYTRAPVARHSAAMNLTIWTEAAVAALLLLNVAGVAIDGARPSSRATVVLGPQSDGCDPRAKRRRYALRG